MTAAENLRTGAGTFGELMNDPSLLMAMGLGSIMSLGLLVAHACCFGGEADALRAIAVLCSMTG